MTFHKLLLVSTLLGAIAIPGMAQSGGGGPSTGANGSPIQPGTQMGTGNIGQEEFNKLQDYVDLSKRLSDKDKAKGKTLEQLLAEDKAAAAALAATMIPSCQTSEAILATEGSMTADGKTVDVKTYEVACANGMGYFLVSQEPNPPYAISCFAAEATGKADVAAGRKPGAVCKLQPNADTNAMAAALLQHAGVTCTARDHRWVGQSSIAHTEYDEVACADNSGYIMAVALPGSGAPVRVSTCHDAALKGLPCKLSDNGTPILTVKTFKDALDKHNVACDAGDDKTIRVMGQENKLKRYVVEFKCAQRPAGTVAYIPLEGNQAPFEVLDCAAAAKRQNICTLNKK
jgi:hypothetical protein